VTIVGDRSSQFCGKLIQRGPARHALFVDDAERFNKTLDDFIAHLPDSGAKVPSGS